MTIGDVTIDVVDVILILYFIGFFVLGFAQGTIRRLLGIGSILFSWFLAANLAEPLSGFLGRNWTQFPQEYSYMIGFLAIFLTSSIALALVAQGFYKPQPLFQKARFYPFWPLEPEGDFVTHDQSQEEYQRFLKA